MRKVLKWHQIYFYHNIRLYDFFHLLVLCSKVIPPTFFVQTFLLLFQRIRNRHQILRFLIPILKILQKNIFGTKQHFLQTFKPNAHETAQKIEKLNFNFLGIQLCIHLQVRTLNFLKISQSLFLCNQCCGAVIREIFDLLIRIRVEFVSDSGSCPQFLKQVSHFLG